MMAETDFVARTAQMRQRLAGVERRLDQIAWTRLAVFIAGSGLEWWTWRFGGGWWMLGLLPLLAGFGALVKWNLRVQKQKRFVLALIRINEEEKARLAGQAPAGDDGGLNHLEKEHPYAADLDLFGQRSLFALLDRAATPHGHAALARWLLQPATRPEAAERQAAVAELAPMIDWRQDLQAEGTHDGLPPVEPARIQQWLDTPSLFIRYPWMPSAAFVLPVVVGLAIAAAIIGWIPWWVPVVQVGLHQLMNRQVFIAMREAYKQTDRLAPVLQSHAALLAQIDAAPFQSPRLHTLQAGLRSPGTSPAAKEIDRLADILHRLELHMNGLVYFFLNNLFFWDIHALRALDRWKADHAGRMPGWFEVLGEVEALCGIAAVRHGHPEWATPELAEGGFLLVAKGAAHPLIPAGVRVASDISLDRPGQVALITGSNMSGKSTYLRTVGVNALLALMGAPACAETFTISPVQIASSMRSADSLEESTSSFYAELKRLRLVITQVQTGQPVLFLLDEVLKGTNSRDRHAGARALVRQLAEGQGAGMVSTHDIELQDLSLDLPDKVHNLSFHCEVAADGSLHFDYKLREGVCQSMNAVALMRAMGIEL